MTTFKTDETTETPGRRRRSVWTWIAVGAAIIVVPIIIAILALMLGRSSGEGPSGSVPPPTSSVPPTPATPVDVTLYFLADYVEGSNTAGPHLIPVTRRVEVVGEADTSTLLGASIVALLEGPTADELARVPGLASSLPAGTELLGLTIDNTADPGVATIDLNSVVASGGGTFSMTSRLAQLIYTATWLTGIDQVELSIDGEPVTVFSSEGIVLDGPQARGDYRDLLPLIFVESPVFGATVTSPIEITGVSNTFEATMQYRIETEDGTVLAEGFTTATCGTGCWGDFDIVADYTLAEQSDGFVVVFESSARDGSPVNVVRIPVTLEAAEGVAPVDLDLVADLPGGIPVDGAVVVEPTLTLTGSMTGAPELLVNGSVVPVTDGRFEVTVQLAPGDNDIVVQAGSAGATYSVTYLPDGEVQFGFVDGFVPADGAGTVTGPDGTAYESPALLSVDYAQWLTGDEAAQAAFEDGVIDSVDEGVPNGYYIRNQNDQLRSIPVREGATVFLVEASPVVAPVPVELTAWLDLVEVGGDGSYFNAGSPFTPYWLVLDADGYLVQIIQQYVP